MANGRYLAPKEAELTWRDYTELARYAASKYRPHQGAKERARRLQRMSNEGTG